MHPLNLNRVGYPLNTSSGLRVVSDAQYKLLPGTTGIHGHVVGKPLRLIAMESHSKEAGHHPTNDDTYAIFATEYDLFAQGRNPVVKMMGILISEVAPYR